MGILPMSFIPMYIGISPVQAGPEPGLSAVEGMAPFGKLRAGSGTHGRDAHATKNALRRHYKQTYMHDARARRPRHERFTCE
ncbi:MAG: hypothetical protein A2Z25_14355 [Planctomycetes bacterium RBG_16_55_9]|nr:MAG: hypothetical protein A2Z25_14355 [Planctomycetes bacterium RBG_16_55_9]